MDEIHVATTIYIGAREGQDLKTEHLLGFKGFPIGYGRN